MTVRPEVFVTVVEVVMGFSLFERLVVETTDRS
jgi:hypothetical protein